MYAIPMTSAEIAPTRYSHFPSGSIAFTVIFSTLIYSSPSVPTADHLFRTEKPNCCNIAITLINRHLSDGSGVLPDLGASPGRVALERPLERLV